MVNILFQWIQIDIRKFCPPVAKHNRRSKQAAIVSKTIVSWQVINLVLDDHIAAEPIVRSFQTLQKE